MYIHYLLLVSRDRAVCILIRYIRQLLLTLILIDVSLYNWYYNPMYIFNWQYGLTTSRSVKVLFVKGFIRYFYYILWSIVHFNKNIIYFIVIMKNQSKYFINFKWAEKPIFYIFSSLFNSTAIKLHKLSISIFTWVNCSNNFKLFLNSNQLSVIKIMYVTI